MEREQLAGAFVIDSAGARPDDRIFVINIWGEPVDSVALPERAGHQRTIIPATASDSAAGGRHPSLALDQRRPGVTTPCTCTASTFGWTRRATGSPTAPTRPTPAAWWSRKNLAPASTMASRGVPTARATGCSTATSCSTSPADARLGPLPADPHGGSMMWAVTWRGWCSASPCAPEARRNDAAARPRRGRSGSSRRRDPARPCTA